MVNKGPLVFKISDILQTSRILSSIIGKEFIQMDHHVLDEAHLIYLLTMADERELIKLDIQNNQYIIDMANEKPYRTM